MQQKIGKMVIIRGNFVLICELLLYVSSLWSCTVLCYNSNETVTSTSGVVDSKDTGTNETTVISHGNETQIANYNLTLMDDSEYGKSCTNDACSYSSIETDDDSDEEILDESESDDMNVERILFYNEIQEASLSAKRFLEAYNMLNRTKLIVVEQPETDADIPMLQVFDNGQRTNYVGFRQIKKYIQELHANSNITWTLFYLKDCKPCKRVLNFLEENDKKHIISTTLCRSTSRAHPEIKKYPHLMSSIGGHVSNSANIIDFLKELLLKKIPRKKINRYIDGEYAGKVMYPRLFSFYYFPGEAEGEEGLAWLEKAKFMVFVDAKPLNVGEYSMEFIDIVNDMMEQNQHVTTPVLVENGTFRNIAMGLFKIKVALLRARLLMEPQPKKIWERMKIYSSGSCPSCQHLEKVLKQNNLMNVEIRKLSNKANYRQFANMGGFSVPALSIDNRIEFLGVSDISSFILLMQMSIRNSPRLTAPTYK